MVTILFAVYPGSLTSVRRALFDREMKDGRFVEVHVHDPVADAAVKVLCLPIYPGFVDGEIGKIVGVIVGTAYYQASRLVKLCWQGAS